MRYKVRRDDEGSTLDASDTSLTPRNARLPTARYRPARSITDTSTRPSRGQ